MTSEKRAKLEAAGYAVVDDADDWLGLDDVERKVVDLMVKVGRETRRRRGEAGMTQEALAKVIGSSRTRISKVESTAPGIGLDLMFRAFFAVGGKVEDLVECPAMAPGE